MEEPNIESVCSDDVSAASPPENVSSSHDDVYGQVFPLESPELISNKLDELETELLRIPEDDRVEYYRAVKKQLCNDSFKLMFLRCEVFNSDLAALRLIRYWKKREELFGSRAHEPLTLKDALIKDTESLEMGFMKLTEGTDRVGRRIVLLDPSRMPQSGTYNRNSIARAVWYTLHAALEDETVQKKGVVILAHPRNAKLNQFDRTMAKMNLESIQGCIPVRICAFHICQPPAFFSTVVFPLLKVFMGARLRKRIKCHKMDDEELLQKLEEKYGIPRDMVPSELGGKLIVNQENWLLDRKDMGM